MAVESNAHPDIERDLSFYPIEDVQPKKLTQTQVQQYNEKGFRKQLSIARTLTI